MPEMHYIRQMLSGVLLSFELFAVTLIAAFVVALLLVIARAGGNKTVRLLVDAFVEYQRNVPLLVHVFFWYFGVPELLPDMLSDWLNNHNSALWLAGVALSLSSAAYISEDIRSGLQAVPATQSEAARSMGASYFQCMRLVIIPQALRFSSPALTGRALLLFKSTSVAMAIGVTELMYQTRDIDDNTFLTFSTYGIATLLYLSGSFLIMMAGRRINAYYQLRGGRNV